MSGTRIERSLAADMSANPSLLVLPGSLASGLIGHFYLSDSLAKVARNLAPGAAQSAVVTGAPTFGTGFANLQVGVNYLSSGLLETAAMTIIVAMETDDPLVTTDVYLAGDSTTDAGQGTGVVGSSLYVFHGVTPSSANVSAQTYFGATFAGRAVSTLNLAGNAVNQWNLYALTIQGVSPWLVKLRNLTTGTSSTLNGANARQINTVQPILIGSRPGGASGTLKVASYSRWNRDLSDSECAQMRSLVLQPYLNGKYSLPV